MVYMILLSGLLNISKDYYEAGHGGRGQRVAAVLVYNPAVLKEHPVFLFRHSDSGYVEAVQ